MKTSEWQGRLLMISADHAEILSVLNTSIEHKHPLCPFIIDVYKRHEKRRDTASWYIKQSAPCAGTGGRADGRRTGWGWGRPGMRPTPRPGVRAYSPRSEWRLCARLCRCPGLSGRRTRAPQLPSVINVDTSSIFVIPWCAFVLFSSPLSQQKQNLHAGNMTYPGFYLRSMWHWNKNKDMNAIAVKNNWLLIWWTVNCLTATNKPKLWELYF